MKLAHILQTLDHLRKAAAAEARTIALSSALNGARYHSDRLKTGGRLVPAPADILADNLPITAREIGRDARAAADEGATFFHVHARNPATGRHSADARDYSACVSEIRREVPGALISGSTGREGEVGEKIESRMEDLALIGRDD